MWYKLWIVGVEHLMALISFLWQKNYVWHTSIVAMLMVKLMFLASRTVGSAKRVGGGHRAKRGKAAWPRVISHQCDGTNIPTTRTCPTLPKLNIHWPVVISLISSCLSPSADQDHPIDTHVRIKLSFWRYGPLQLLNLYHISLLSNNEIWTADFLRTIP